MPRLIACLIGAALWSLAAGCTRIEHSITPDPPTTATRIADYEPAPVLYDWPDRRPIGVVWLAASDRVSEKNPHGLFDRDLDTSDRAAVVRAAEKLTAATVANCLAIGAQGLYFHGFTAAFKTTRIEYQNPIPLPPELSYPTDLGDGRELPLLEAILVKCHAAGLRTGCLIKPYAPTGDFLASPPVYRGDVPHGDPLKWLSRSIDWARSKGMSLFYVDSPRVLDYAPLRAGYPDCLFALEITTSSPYAESEEWKYRVGPAWCRWNLNNDYVGRGYAVVFAVDHAPGQTDEQLKARLRKAKTDGSIPAPFVWYESRGLRLLKEVLAEK